MINQSQYGSALSHLHGNTWIKTRHLPSLCSHCCSCCTRITSSSTMARTGLAALLLFLGLIVSTAHSDDSLCTILNDAANDNSSVFELTINPSTLSSTKTDYTVSLSGNSNYTVILQAVKDSASVGSWSGNSNNCSGNPLFIFANGTVQATWTSSGNETSVNISAHIRYDNNKTVIITKQLSQVPTTVPPTSNTTAVNATTVPPTSNTTAVNATTGPVANNNSSSSTTAATANNTTEVGSSASSVQTNLITMAFLVLLTFTSKYLS